MKVWHILATILQVHEQDCFLVYADCDSSGREYGLANR